MFARLPGIGLDIGSQKTKLIRVAHKKSDLEVIKFGTMETPATTIKSGLITDPETLGKEMRCLVKELKLNGKHVVSAVGGQQIFMRTFIMPAMPVSERKSALHYQAMNYLPLPVEEAVVDFYVIRDFETADGKQTEFFMVAVEKQQIENIKLTCRIAGLKLVVLEVEPQAIFRMVGGGPAITALLNIGWTRSYLFVFRFGVPVFWRPISIGSSVFSSATYLARGEDRVGESSGIWTLNYYDYKQLEIIAEIKDALEYYSGHYPSPTEAIEKIWLCGGGAINGLETTLARGLECEIETVNINHRLKLPNQMGMTLRNQLQQDFVIALGLAARRVF